MDAAGAPFFQAATMGQGLRAAALRHPSKVAVTDEAGNARRFGDYIANVNRAGVGRIL